MKEIKRALISVFDKDGLESIVRKLDNLNVEIYSTGGTFTFIESLGIKCKTVESLTSYPSILGGRVKTLHPKVFGGILSRRDNPMDIQQMQEYQIPEIDLVIVDLYPFEQTVASGASEQEIIEKIDIGGISLIRAAAKNFKDVVIVPSKQQYAMLEKILDEKKNFTSIEDRRMFATYAFLTSSHYDTAIHEYFNPPCKTLEQLFEKEFIGDCTKIPLRYGENPHQQAVFYGNMQGMFEQLHGKQISFNNIGDIDAACNLIDDFSETTFAIIKHNNACGVASRNTLKQAYLDALAGDPVSAFGGIFVTNAKIDKETAIEMDKVFMEVCIAPDYDQEALDILFSKKNRIILKRKEFLKPQKTFRSALNGVLVQDRDSKVERPEEMVSVTPRSFTEKEKEDLSFANIIVKNTKSNAIVIAKDKQLLASGTGQTSRVDAFKQAIAKAKFFGFEVKGSVLASDAFFPFSDCVDIAYNEGIEAIVQPGGSIRDKDSVDYCIEHNMAMAMTGTRHFRH